MDVKSSWLELVISTMLLPIVALIMGGKLSRGKLEATVVTCPLHGSQFDLSDGSVVRWLKGSGLISAIGMALKSPLQLTTYNVNIEDDRILVEV